MKLLIIGQLQGHLSLAAQIAMKRGATVINSNTIEQSLLIMRDQGADLIIVEVTQPISSLSEILKKERIFCPIIACGIDVDADQAALAIRSGAIDFIPLPPDSELIAAMLSLVSQDNHNIVWRDPVMEKIVRMAETIARSEASVLITGESGTGKELIARHIHKNSNRRDRPFVSVNCAAIPDTLLESELFGYEKGAFTGATGRRIGKFEEANHGTLLLDEISEMDIKLQAKLLRALQERVIDRIGGNRPIQVNIRILATSNINLLEAVEKKLFREDLFYRLNVVSVKMPALRERPQDILPLANYFIKKYSQTNDIPLRRLSFEAKRKLLAHNWRGNVRELENQIHRAVLLESGPEINVDSIIEEYHGASESKANLNSNIIEFAKSFTTELIGKTVEEVEKSLIIDTLSHCHGNKTQAAKILGISIRTLRNKLNDYSSVVT